MKHSPTSAAAELLRRRAIRRDLAQWGRYRGFDPAPHHRLICREIDAFLDSDDEVLLLFAPPGSAKSTWVSVLFPSYYLARFPQNSILAATHSVEFAQRWGRRVRNDIAVDSAVLGIELSPTVRPPTAGRWRAAASITGSAPASASRVPRRSRPGRRLLRQSRGRLQRDGAKEALGLVRR